MPGEMLDERDGDLADRVVLTDDGLLQLFEDVLWAEREGFHDGYCMSSAILESDITGERTMR